MLHPPSTTFSASTFSSTTDRVPKQKIFKLKFVIAGDHNVGKTAIAKRFAMDLFPSEYKQTVGLDFFKQSVSFPDGRSADVQIWDISGDALHSRMLKNCLYGANAIFLVYDVTNFSSFRGLQEWFHGIESCFGNKLPLMILVGNKLDLGNLRTVTNEEHGRFAHEIGSESCLISAKTKDSLALPFVRTAAECLGIDAFKLDMDFAQGIVKAMVLGGGSNDEHSAEHGELISRAKQGEKCALM